MITITGTTVAIEVDNKIIETHKIENKTIREFIAKIVTHVQQEEQIKGALECDKCNVGKVPQKNFLRNLAKRISNDILVHAEKL